MIETPTILLNDFQRQWATTSFDAIQVFESVGASGWYILGKEVAAFEAELGELVGRQVIGCGNGLDGLEIALRISGIKSGDRVLTTPLSAFATTLAILRIGAVPVFVDVDDTGLMDLAAAECFLEGDRSVRAVLPVHLFGHPLDLDRLARIRDYFGVAVIEDCAQAIGASSHGRAVGSVGDASATSFYPTKNLGCMGDGGAIFTGDKARVSLARALRDYGQTAKYVHDNLGMNSRLDELQAALLRKVLLPRLPIYTELRRQVAEAYRKAIRNPLLTLPPVAEHGASVWHLFPVLVKEDREGFESHMSKAQIQTGRHYPLLIPEQAALGSSRITDCERRFPIAYRYSRCEVSLPIHPFLTPDEIERVVLACNGWKP